MNKRAFQATCNLKLQKPAFLLRSIDKTIILPDMFQLLASIRFDYTGVTGAGTQRL